VDKKNSLPYEIDGLVVKVNDISVWEKLGLTAHHPRYAIAYKFPSEMATTKVESVEYSV
jgi:DNA ligase (NAD+)